MQKSLSVYWFLFASFTILIFDYLSFMGFVKSSIEEVVVKVKQPVYFAKNSATEAVSAISLYPDLVKLKKETEKLVLENQELNLEAEILKEENRALRHQLEAPMPASFKYIPAQVISVSSFMEVAVGEKDGVKPGMAVVSGEVLVGKVTNASYQRSKVMLITDQESKVTAKTLRETKGTVVGHLGESFQIIQVLQKDPLFIDDTVITSGEDGLPPNLLIGKIEHITTSDVSPYKQAKTSSLLDFASLEVVFIVSSV